MANTNDHDGLPHKRRQIVARAMADLRQQGASQTQLHLMSRTYLMNRLHLTNRLHNMNRVIKMPKRSPLHWLPKPMPKLCTMQNPSVTERDNPLLPLPMPISFTIQAPTKRGALVMPRPKPRPTSVDDADRGNGGTGDSNGNGGSDVDDTIITNPMLMMLPTKRAPEKEHPLDKYRCLGFDAFREIVKSEMEDSIKRLIEDRKQRGINT